MTCVVVNDASCLIDLRKGRLLHVLLRLPCRFVVPLPIREEELLDFTDQEVAEAFAVKRQHSRLSANDCFALVATAHHADGVLLTGDGTLRKVAASRDVRVHGVLWVVDQLHAGGFCEPDLLVSALTTWRDDSSVFLPPDKIEALMMAVSEGIPSNSYSN